MKIGNIEVGFLALGPMAGVTDMQLRILCKEQGADLIYTEMVSAKGIHYNNTNTKDMLHEYLPPVVHECRARKVRL